MGLDGAGRGRTGRMGRSEMGWDRRDGLGWDRTGRMGRSEIKWDIT